MATITEDYVSFETAKLLKKKGFDEECKRRYNCRGELSRVDSMVYRNSHRDMQDKYVAPTLQMAMKWLREVYNLYIQIAVTSWPQKGHSVHIYMYNDRYNNFEEVPFVEHKESYEEACEAAIKYCLENLI